LIEVGDGFEAVVLGGRARTDAESGAVIGIMLERGEGVGEMAGIVARRHDT